jgi:hypothetical protein
MNKQKVRSASRNGGSGGNKASSHSQQRAQQASTGGTSEDDDDGNESDELAEEERLVQSTSAQQRLPQQQQQQQQQQQHLFPNVQPLLPMPLSPMQHSIAAFNPASPAQRGPLHSATSSAFAKVSQQTTAAFGTEETCGIFFLMLLLTRRLVRFRFGSPLHSSPPHRPLISPLPSRRRRCNSRILWNGVSWLRHAPLLRTVRTRRVRAVRAATRVRVAVNHSTTAPQAAPPQPSCTNRSRATRTAHKQCSHKCNLRIISNSNHQRRIPASSVELRATALLRAALGCASSTTNHTNSKAFETANDCIARSSKRPCNKSATASDDASAGCPSKKEGAEPKSEQREAEMPSVPLHAFHRRTASDGRQSEREKGDQPAE